MRSKDGIEKAIEEIAELKVENAILKEENYDKLIAWEEMQADNERLYEEKNCLHKIIDRLLDNAGYSKDIASAEDFEDVYENMQYNRQKLSEYKQTLQEIKGYLSTLSGVDNDFVNTETYLRILDLITKAESEDNQ